MKIKGRFWRWIEVKEDHHDICETELSVEELANQLTDEDITGLAKRKHIVSIQAPPQEMMSEEEIEKIILTHTDNIYIGVLEETYLMIKNNKELIHALSGKIPKAEKPSAKCPNCGHPFNDRGTDREHPEAEKPAAKCCNDFGYPHGSAIQKDSAGREICMCCRELIKPDPKPAEEKEYCNCSNRYVCYSGTLTQEQIDALPCQICHKPKKPAEPSICDSCVEICKATHPRKSCILFREARKGIEKLKLLTVLGSNEQIITDKINEIVDGVNKLEGK